MTRHRAIRGEFTDYSANASYATGEKRRELTIFTTAGGQTFTGWNTYTYVRNSSLAAFVVGNPIIRDATTPGIGFNGTAGAAVVAPARHLGMAISAIPAGYYGWVLTAGYGLAHGDAAIAAGEYVVSDNAFYDTIAGGEVAVGVALEADVATYFPILLLGMAR